MKSQKHKNYMDYNYTDIKVYRYTTCWLQLNGLNFAFQDLAARNVLVDENQTCKISDFGLLREVPKEKSFTKPGPITSSLDGS